MTSAREPMSKSRVEAFSDGVIGVAITLLVLSLKVPNPHDPGSLGHRLAQQWPHYIAYVISFLTIGVIWINHHAMLRRLISVDHSVLTLNLVLLMTIVVLPFTTALLAEYLTSGEGARLAAVIYGGSFSVMALTFVLTQRHIVLNRLHLLHEHLTPHPALLRRSALGITPYLLATLSGLITPYATLCIAAAPAVFFALPQRQPDSLTRSPVQAPPASGPPLPARPSEVSDRERLA